jgi:hypothetical protein
MKEGYICLDCNKILDSPECSCKNPDISMVGVLENGDDAFTAGANIFRKNGRWIISSLEDDTWYDGQLVNDSDNGEVYVGLPGFEKEQKFLQSIKDKDLPLHLDHDWKYDLNKINFTKRLEGVKNEKV